MKGRSWYIANRLPHGHPQDSLPQEAGEEGKGILVGRGRKRFVTGEDWGISRAFSGKVNGRKFSLQHEGQKMIVVRSA